MLGGSGIVGRISISLSKDDEKLLRDKAGLNYRSVSKEVSYLLHIVYDKKPEKSGRDV